MVYLEDRKEPNIRTRILFKENPKLKEPVLISHILTDSERIHNRRISKQQDTRDFVIKKLKVLAENWAGNHLNCFRASPTETEEHIRLKFERWLTHRKMQIPTLTELKLKTGDKPDMIVIGNTWENSHIEEIVVTEKDDSIEDKRKRYPFPIRIVKRKVT